MWRESPAHTMPGGTVRTTRTSPVSARARRWKRSRKHGHVLTPGRYVGAAPQEDDGEPFEEKMSRLTAQWREQQEEAQRLDEVIEANLVRLGLMD